MTKPQLRVLAIVLSGLILVVLFAGLDDLPRKLRKEIASEQQSLTSIEKDLQKTRSDVAADVRGEPGLFRVHSMDSALPARLDRAGATLQSADREMAALAGLAKANRRRDEDQVTRLLRDERGLRTSAAAEVSAVARDARHWLDQKQHLPEQVAQMERDYQTLHQIDLTEVTAAAKRAETDWPEKQADLEGRLTSLWELPPEAEKQWQASAGIRAKVKANDLAGLDYVSLIAAADTMHQAAAGVPAQAGQLQDLAGQLYDSWDRILVDLEIRRSGERRFYDEKLRTVRTHLVNVAARQAETKDPEERWVEVSKAQYESVENNLGMAVEHKPAGKYDSEAERVAQPAGFAYVAPPAQGSNQYGYWSHQGGGNFWVWFPQYLLLRDLLYAHDYRPLTTFEWEEYRTARSSGRTYYGHDETARGSAPKYGSQGTFTQRRYADSNYARNGGYRGSRFATGSGGGYGGSRYESRGAQSGQDSQPHTFGRSGGSESSGKSDNYRSWSGHSSGQGSRASPRSAPPRSAPRSPGRSFGGGRRR